MSFYTWLWGQLQHNQFLTAALVAAPATALLYTARSLPGKIFTAVKHQITYEVRFNSDLDDYQAIQEFVADQIVSRRFTRNYVYMSERKWNREIESYEESKAKLTPGYGDHIGWWKRRLVFVERIRVDSQGTTAFKESLTLTFITRDMDVIRGFIDELCDHIDYRGDVEFVPMFINSEDYWKFGSRLPNRPLSTVFLPPGDMQRALDHIREFQARKGWYRERGLPWHTGILLTGKPGTGKTSLVHALASELRRTIYYLNLGSIESDQELSALVSGSRNWHNALLVIEDADAGGVGEPASSDEDTDQKPSVVMRGGKAVVVAKKKRRSNSKKSVSLSALLNVLDGLLTPDGLIVIASSNHPENLDPALLRPGRFDLHLEIGDMDWLQFAEMARLFGYDIADDDPRKANFTPAPGANLRAKLLEDGVDAIIGTRVQNG
jgi:hypothetical protein